MMGMTIGEDYPTQDKLKIVNPYITLDDLKGYWVGLGAAIEWIAMRGKEMTLAEYETRFDEGTEELVRLLANLPDDEALRIVRGENVDELGPLVPVPSGIWRQTATSDANDEGKLYRLIGTDDDDEWEGAILSAHHGGYRKVQVGSDFILANWPADATRKTPAVRQGVSMATLRRFIRQVIAITPDELQPLTIREMRALVKQSLPDAPRNSVDEIYAKLVPPQRPGPRGARSFDRAIRVEELSQKMLTGQLDN
jgi:hypothetical protein